MEKYSIIKEEKLVDSVNTLFINFQGNLTIESSNNLNKIFQEIVRDYGSYDLNISKIESIDLTFLQLLFAFKSEIDNENKKININFEIENELFDLLVICGFSKCFQLKILNE